MKSGPDVIETFELDLGRTFGSVRAQMIKSSNSRASEQRSPGQRVP